MTPRPTIAELVPFYLPLGFSVKEAVHSIVSNRLISKSATGNGNAARRRKKSLVKIRIRRENAWNRHTVRGPLTPYEQLGNHQARKEFEEQQLIG